MGISNDIADIQILLNQDSIRRGRTRGSMHWIERNCLKLREKHLRRVRHMLAVEHQPIEPGACASLRSAVQTGQQPTSCKYSILALAAR